LANRFEALTIEEIDEEIITSTPSAVPRLSTISTTKSKTPVAKLYEFDLGTDQDLHFVVFCFFEDVHRLHDFLSET
jgi:hypothetical protein